MNTLEIISTQTTVQAKQIINGNTANFSWNKDDAAPVAAINFYVQRGEAGDEGFTGNSVITGAYYPESGKFDVQNNNFQEGDFAVYVGILDTCKGIAAPGETEIEEGDGEV